MSSLTNCILIIISMFLFLEACGDDNSQVVPEVQDAGLKGEDVEITLCQVSQDKVGQQPCPTKQGKP